MANVLGLESAALFNTGTIAAPTYGAAPISSIMDLSLNLEMGLADVTTRAAGGYRLQRGTLIDAGVDMTLLYDTSNADFTALQTAFFARTQVNLMVLDGDPNLGGSGDTYSGLFAAFNVTNFTMSQSLEEAVTVDVTLVLDSENTTNAAPVYKTITIA